MSETEKRTSRTNVLDPRDARNVANRYRARIAEHGVSFLSLAAGNAEKQTIRNAVHASAISGECHSLLDLGCGLGGFYRYLKEHGQAGRYVGYDIVPEYVEACRVQFPDAEFQLRNVFTDGIDRTFDTVVMSQVLNNRYENSDNLLVMQNAIEMAWRHTRKSISIDMMSTYVDFQNPDLFYYSPEEIFRFAKSLCRRVLLRHDYRSHEFCIQLFHPGAEGFVP